MYVFGPKKRDKKRISFAIFSWICIAVVVGVGLYLCFLPVPENTHELQIKSKVNETSPSIVPEEIEVVSHDTSHKINQTVSPLKVVSNDTMKPVVSYEFQTQNASSNKVNERNKPTVPALTIPPRVPEGAASPPRSQRTKRTARQSAHTGIIRERTIRELLTHRSSWCRLLTAENTYDNSTINDTFSPSVNFNLVFINNTDPVAAGETEHQEEQEKQEGEVGVGRGEEEEEQLETDGDDDDEEEEGEEAEERDEGDEGEKQLETEGDDDDEEGERRKRYKEEEEGGQGEEPEQDASLSDQDASEQDRQRDGAEITEQARKTVKRKHIPNIIMGLLKVMRSHRKTDIVFFSQILPTKHSKNFRPEIVQGFKGTRKIQVEHNAYWDTVFKEISKQECHFYKVETTKSLTINATDYVTSVNVIKLQKHTGYHFNIDATITQVAGSYLLKSTKL